MSRKSIHPPVSRRDFLATATTGLGAAGALAWTSGTALPDESSDAKPFCFGLVTDVHYADAPARGSRHYRDSLAKLRQAVDTFNARKVAFVAELGDLIDVGPAGPDKEVALGHLRAINEVFGRLRAERHYVLGNHCLDALSKEQFLAACGASGRKSYYSFDAGPFHFVLLDADFRKDGTPYESGNFTWTDTWIPGEQQQWLADDLRKAQARSTFVFVHQNLHDETDAHGVKNAPEVRRVLESAGNVAAVFQGHMHPGGRAEMAGIHYVTLRAMVEGPTLANNAYAIVTVGEDGTLAVEGFARQETLRFRDSLPALRGKDRSGRPR